MLKNKDVKSLLNFFCISQLPCANISKQMLVLFCLKTIFICYLYHQSTGGFSTHAKLKIRNDATTVYLILRLMSPSWEEMERGAEEEMRRRGKGDMLSKEGCGLLTSYIAVSERMRRLGDEEMRR